MAEVKLWRSEISEKLEVVAHRKLTNKGVIRAACWTEFWRADQDKQEKQGSCEQESNLTRGWQALLFSGLEVLFRVSLEQKKNWEQLRVG